LTRTSLRLHARPADLPVVSICRNPTALRISPNQIHNSRHPGPTNEGRRDRHGRWAWDAVDAGCASDEGAIPADGEVVWSWHPDADAKLATMLRIVACDGGKKARSPGRARSKPLKPLRRECRVFRLQLRWLRSCAFSISHARLRVPAAHPVFPAPSILSGWRISGTTRALSRRGKADVRGWKVAVWKVKSVRTQAC